MGFQTDTSRWRHYECDSVSNHQPHDCLINPLFRLRSKTTPKLRVTGLCVGNSPGTGEFPAQMASNAENVSIWWRHHELDGFACRLTQWWPVCWVWPCASWWAESRVRYNSQPSLYIILQNTDFAYGQPLPSQTALIISSHRSCC